MNRDPKRCFQLEKYFLDMSECVTRMMRNYGNIYCSDSVCLKASVSSDGRLISMVRHTWL